jgi:hypothetical protein
VTAGPASRRQHARFCEIEQWEPARNARGKEVQHHPTYELTLPNGDILRTRISRPLNNQRYGAALWHEILTTQLRVTEQQFWHTINTRTPPERGTSTGAPDNTIPAGLAYQLIHTAGLTETEVGALTREQAIARMNEHWTTGS